MELKHYLSLSLWSTYCLVSSLKLFFIPLMPLFHCSNLPTSYLQSQVTDGFSNLSSMSFILLLSVRSPSAILLPNHFTQLSILGKYCQSPEPIVPLSVVLTYSCWPKSQSNCYIPSHFTCCVPDVNLYLFRNLKRNAMKRFITDMIWAIHLQHILQLAVE